MVQFGHVQIVRLYFVNSALIGFQRAKIERLNAASVDKNPKTWSEVEQSNKSLHKICCLSANNRTNASNILIRISVTTVRLATYHSVPVAF